MKHSTNVARILLALGLVVSVVVSCGSAEKRLSAEQAEVVATLARSMAPPEEAAPASKCMIETLETSEVDLDAAFASPESGALLVSALRCVNDPKAMMFTEDDLAASELMTSEEKVCAADAFIDGLRDVPLDEADDYMTDGSLQLVLMEQAGSSCGLTAEQMATFG